MTAIEAGQNSGSRVCEVMQGISKKENRRPVPQDLGSPKVRVAIRLRCTWEVPPKIVTGREIM